MTAPAFIRFSTYLTHEIIGLAFALWAIHLLERALAKQGRVEAVAFGFFCAATWTARPNTAIFIAPPLLLLFWGGIRHLRPATIVRFLLFSLLGLLGCMFAIYRPALIAHLTSKFGSFFFVFYDFGLFLGETTSVAFATLTPMLVVLAAAGLLLLVVRRKFLVASIAVSWLLAAYIFYIGMHCRDRYFIVMIPPCLMLCFAGADEIDNGVRWGEGRFPHSAKALALVLLLAFSLGPAAPNLLRLRTANDDEAAARMIGEVVDSNLLFTTSFEPLVQYYNREKPPETVYLVREYSPGKIKVDLDGLQMAQNRLREGRPVFATDEIIRNLRLLGIDVTAEQVRQYKTLRLFRITALKVDRSNIIGIEAK
jgi:4-amino-4-deoxy-L-arabinose transferase-like glycosyltransferase